MELIARICILAPLPCKGRSCDLETLVIVPQGPTSHSALKGFVTATKRHPAWKMHFVVLLFKM